MDSNSFSGDPSLQRLADDAMQRDYPERFSSRAEWDAYNEMLATREASLEHRALHGDLNSQDDDNDEPHWDEEASRWTGSDPTGGFGQASFHFC